MNLSPIPPLSQQAKEWIRQHAPIHLGKNIRTVKWTTWTGEVKHNSLGGVNYLTPKEGKVVEIDDLFTAIKVGTNDFCIVLSSLMDAAVSVGDKVALNFYQLRRFDGSLADGSEDESKNGCRTIALTGARTIFPVKWKGRYLGINDRFADSYTTIGNPYLRDFITQMETIAVDGGLRHVVNILVDAGATQLSFNDPSEEDSAVDAPAIRCQVNTAKHRGGIEIGYDRASDTYYVHTTDGKDTIERLEDVHFDELGPVLIALIDDRAWLKARVTVLKPAPKKRSATMAEAA